jgi:hypothetical protein
VSARTDARLWARRRAIVRTTRAQLEARGAKAETVERRIDERIDTAGGWTGNRKVTCVECGTTFTARRWDARFCSPLCQKRARRRELRNDP